MDATRKESIKLSIGVVGSVLAAAVAMILVSSQLFDMTINIIIIPIVAYIISVIMSGIYQYSICKKLNMGSILVGDLGVVLTNLILGILLFAEQIPVYKYAFGSFAPRNPISGLPYDSKSAEYGAAMGNENHYKIQFFSGIVKAILPVYFDENVKEGVVYLYWTFWMTMLPLYFVMGTQGLC